MAFVEALKQFGVIKTPRVADAFRKVDRRFFVKQGDPYFDAPMATKHGQTISAPHMHAHVLEQFESRLKPGVRVLDVGSGSGVLLGLIYEMIEEKGRVVGIDIHRDLVSQSKENLEAAGYKEALDSGALNVRYGDGWQGVPDLGPYDIIHVGAAAARIPDALVEQLAPGGILVLPVGPHGGRQEMVEVTKDEAGKVTRTPLGLGVVFVPLVEAN